jgi:NADH:ubiquinone oxidoreductase subunit 6 (subunit J)
MKRMCATVLSVALLFAAVFLITTNSPWWAALMLAFFLFNESEVSSKPTKYTEREDDP